ncbi:energy-coupled thiamine transporter ThiT [Lachnospiraceae bacterium 42-17]|jgi:thiamine transporter|nr:energy-coupled thiamine transporter ThiT [Dorea sp.]
MSKNYSNTGRSVSATTDTVKKLVFSAMGIALGMVTSYIKVWEMPMGGSVTLLSMLFICLIGFWFGPRYGIAAGAAYGILQFVIDPYMLSVPQVLFDYPFAFGALGLSGFFRNQKYGLQLGYIAGVLGRFLFSTLSGVFFFAAYAPEGMNPLIYSSLYQGSYLGTEGIVTLIIISLPPVTKALNIVKQQTRS